MNPEKHDHPITVKLTETQSKALQIESRMTGESEVELIRSFINNLYQKQIQAYRLLEDSYKNTENKETNVYSETLASRGVL